MLVYSISVLHLTKIKINVQNIPLAYPFLHQAEFCPDETSRSGPRYLTLPQALQGQIPNHCERPHGSLSHNGCGLPRTIVTERTPLSARSERPLHRNSQGLLEP